MSVGLALAFNILMWSLYPLASIYTLDDLNPFALMLAVQFIAYLGAMVFSFILLKRKNQLNEFVQLQRTISKDKLMIAFIAGACSGFSHAFFVLALTMANKGGVSILFESWPIIALILAPHMIDKDWNKSSWKDYSIAFIALIGVAVIILSDKDINWLQGEDWDIYALMAYMITLLASYMTALLAILRTNYAQVYEPLENDFAAVMLSEAIVRFFASICLAVVGIAFGMNLQVSMDQLPMLLLIGIGIFALGGSAYTYALLKAKNPNIVIFDYLIPIIAVVWLIMFGLTELTAWLAIGSIITIGACAYLTYENQKTSS